MQELRLLQNSRTRTLLWGAFIAAQAKDSPGDAGNSAADAQPSSMCPAHCCWGTAATAALTAGIFSLPPIPAHLLLLRGIKAEQPHLPVGHLHRPPERSAPPVPSADQTDRAQTLRSSTRLLTVIVSPSETVAGPCRISPASAGMRRADRDSRAVKPAPSACRAACLYNTCTEDLDSALPGGCKKRTA